jgi:hypothetical protein
MLVELVEMKKRPRVEWIVGLGGKLEKGMKRAERDS